MNCARTLYAFASDGWNADRTVAEVKDPERLMRLAKPGRATTPVVSREQAVR